MICRECRRKARERVCEQCSGKFYPNCAPSARNPQRFCSAACRIESTRIHDDPRAANKASVRARKLQVRLTWDGVTDQQIFERDGWVCLIPGCGRPIQRELKHPDPMSASVDHIVPLSRGGGDTAPNKRAAHLRCNVSRGPRMHESDVQIVTPALAPLGIFPLRQTARVPVYCIACHTAEVKRDGGTCPACRVIARQARRAAQAELGHQIRECREAGMKWDDIAVKFGLSGSGAAYNIAYPPGRPSPIRPLKIRLGLVRLNCRLTGSVCRWIDVYEPMPEVLDPALEKRLWWTTVRPYLSVGRH